MAPLRFQTSSWIALSSLPTGSSGCPCPSPSFFFWPWGPMPPSWSPSGWRPLWMSPCTTCSASSPWGHGALPHRYPQGPGHILVWPQVHQLCCQFCSDVYHELLSYHGVLHIHGYGLRPLCGHLPSTEIPIHHHWAIYSQGGHFYLSQKCTSNYVCFHPLCLTPLLWEKCHWELHLCQYVCLQTLLWWCHYQSSPPICWRLDSAGIWLHPHLPLLHPHTKGCSETQGRRICCKDLKHMWLPLYPDPLLQHHSSSLCPHPCGKEESVPWLPVLLNVLHHVIPAAFNPIVYGVQTQEIKQGIQRLLKKGW